MVDRKNKKIIIFLLIIFISIGFASLAINLGIKGSVKFKNPNWNIHFENIQVKRGSTKEDTPVINKAGNTVTYSINFEQPGDYYEFTVDAVNDGIYNGIINDFVKTELSEELLEHVVYTVTYDDGSEIKKGDILEAKTYSRIKVHLEYNNVSEFLEDDISNYELQLTINYEKQT